MKKVIVLAVSLCMCLGLLAGCQSVLSPTQTADAYLIALKAQDTDAAEKVYAGSVTDFESKFGENGNAELSSLMNEKMVPKFLDFDYELSNEKIDGDKATVDVKITTYDMGSAFTSSMTDYISQAFTLAMAGGSDEEMSSLFAKILDEKLNTVTKSYSKTTTLSLTKTDGKWIVDNLSTNEEFLDAFSGGLLSSLEGMSSAFSSDSTTDSSSSAPAA